ncbi:MAG: hypothetical protein BWY31_00533 [Lentisphaerae bacterium ADurb.Bin242]|nr:MAG: hypothetical protein BWY31_00533 [Lentisphaerae bacterium ADurb.Bin242]
MENLQKINRIVKNCMRKKTVRRNVSGNLREELFSTVLKNEYFYAILSSLLLENSVMNQYKLIL